MRGITSHLCINTTDINPFRYGGEQFDKETGRIYLRARYYDPATGRFLEEDTYTGKATDPLSLNLYTYCEGDPVNYIDPTGHEEVGDYDAYLTGKISKETYDILYDLGLIYENTNDPAVQNACHQAAVAIRLTFNPTYHDTYDYSHGGTYDASKDHTQVDIAYMSISESTASIANIVISGTTAVAVGAATAALAPFIADATAVSAGGASGFLTFITARLTLPDVLVGTYVHVHVSKWGIVSERDYYGSGCYFLQDITQGPAGSALNGTDTWKLSPGFIVQK